jgi:hypothetical protein
VGEGHDLRALAQHPVERLEIEQPIAGERDGPHSHAAIPGRHLPRNDVRVVLHVGDEDLVPRPERPAQRLGHQIDAVGGPAREDDLLAARRADEALDPVARRLVQLGGLFAERVDRAVHVGVARRVVLVHRLQHRAGLLAGGRRIQVDERMAVDRPGQDREVAAGLLVESHG